MNIKSLLIGSAAALVAVSGARAADAVVAEPEAVEYVRVCDAYGAGFFYIPGTETCLKIGGFVRYQIDFANGDNGWKKKAQAMVNLTASSDTELGTLTSYIELGGARVAGVASGGMTVDYAWISLGGLTMGYHDSAFGGGLDGEGGVGGYGDQMHLMSYTFSGGNGFSATVSAEENTFNVDYVPNLVAKVSYTAGTVGVDAWAAYDSTAKQVAVKGRLSVAVGDAGSLKVLAAYNAKPNFYAQENAKWTLGASYSHKLNDKLALTGVAQYLNGGLGNHWHFGGVVDYTIVPGFSAKLAVVHTTKNAAALLPASTSGFLRFQRSF